MSNQFGVQVLGFDDVVVRDRQIKIGAQGGVSHSLATYINNDYVSTQIFGPEKYDSEILPVHVSDKNELFTNTVASNSSSRVVYDNGTITADKYVLVVDLDNSNGEWPHTYSGTSTIYLDAVENDIIFQTNNAECKVNYGLITRVDGTDADIYYLTVNAFGNASAKNGIHSYNNYQPSHVTFEVEDGKPKNALTNMIETTTSVNTSTPILNPSTGTVYPAVGDLVCKFEHLGQDYVSTKFNFV